MTAETCYTISPTRPGSLQWMNTDASNREWWVETSCLDFVPPSSSSATTIVSSSSSASSPEAFVAELQSQLKVSFAHSSLAIYAPRESLVRVQVFDMLGKYLGTVELNAGVSVKELLLTKFGKSAYPAEQVLQLERKLCTGNHRFTHLFYTRGEIVELRGVYSTFEMHQRKRVQELIAENRAYYRANERANRVQIGKLSTRIMNSVLLHMQPEPVKANAGAIDPAQVWGAARLRISSHSGFFR